MWHKLLATTPLKSKTILKRKYVQNKLFFQALYYENLPAIFFGSLALIASFMVFTLPETINVPLPDTIEEAERLSQVKKEKVFIE